MKNHLSPFRRSPWLSIACLLILGLMLAPVGIMAATSAPATPLASLGFNPMMLGALGIGAVCYGLQAPASDEGGGGGTGAQTEEKLDLAAAVAQIEDRTLPLSQRLGVAVRVLKGIDPTQQLAGVQQQLTDANATVALRDGEITKLKAELATAQQTVAAREKDVTELEAANAKLETEAKDLRAKEQDLEKRAGQKSKERVAALGFPAAKLPAPSAEQESEIPATRADLEVEMSKLKTVQERRELLHKFRAQHPKN